MEVIAAVFEFRNTHHNDMHVPCSLFLAATRHRHTNSPSPFLACTLQSGSLPGDLV